jgi:hypothetical protein
MTKIEWYFLRTSILALMSEQKTNEDGTSIPQNKSPRRFSEAYIKEEREKLKAYREVFREIMKQMQMKNFAPDSNGDLSMLQYDKKSPFFNEERVKEVLSMIKEF